MYHLPKFSLSTHGKNVKASLPGITLRATSLISSPARLMKTRPSTLSYPCDDSSPSSMNSGPIRLAQSAMNDPIVSTGTKKTMDAQSTAQPNRKQAEVGVPILDPKIINEIMEGRDPFIINVQFEETEPQQLLLNSEDSLPSPGTSDNELKPPSRYRMNRRREDIPVDSEQVEEHKQMKLYPFVF